MNTYNKSQGQQDFTEQKRQHFKQDFRTRENYNKEQADKFKDEWIKKVLNDDAIKFADDFGKYLTDAKKDEQLTTSQIRNFFGEMRRIQLKGFKNEATAFLLLKPKLAYMAARVNKERINTFRKVMDFAHGAVGDSEERFKNYCDLLEAILAYHKAHGGK